MNQVIAALVRDVGYPSLQKVDRLATTAILALESIRVSACRCAEAAVRAADATVRIAVAQEKLAIAHQHIARDLRILTLKLPAYGGRSHEEWIAQLERGDRANG